MPYDWSSFTKKITLKAPVEKIYQSFSTRSGIESWFLRSSVYKNKEGDILNDDEMVEENYHYSWKWFGYPDEVNENGKILKANGKDVMEFTFNGNGTNDIRVIVSLSELEGERLVSLRL